ncbi:MAG: alpha-amylase family glycosyl hydrolase [Tenuifilaceae bacterium]
MKKIFYTVILFLGTILPVFSQITANPALPTDADQVVITFDATTTSLLNYTGDVYAHTGVRIEGSTTWQYVKGTWGNNSTQPKLTRITANTYSLTLSPSIRQYYGVPDAQKITQLCFVFRSSDGTKQSADLFYSVYAQGLSVSFTNPVQNKPIYELNSTISVQVNSNSSTSLKLYIDNIEVSGTATSSITYSYTANSYGKHWFKAIASSATETKKDSVYIIVRPNVITEELPVGLTPGVNIVDNSTVTLVLNDPIALKNFCYVIGDFSSWQIDEQYYMKRTPDGKHFWLTLSNLDPTKEYIYQFLIDGYLRIADPYTEKTSDPNDKYISSTNYPNLIPYPTGKTTGIASVFSTTKTTYAWSVNNFTPPAKENLVIYELHIRDFISGDYIKTVQDSLSYLSKLGVNAIELMPFNEFEGNDSWGYNPSFYFAPDKAYGTPNNYKEFIDECHKLGIAVIMDIVFNHSYGQSPLVQMYSTSDGISLGTPTANNPWYNQTSPNTTYSWGYDFNHESQYTKDFIDKSLKYWITEYKIDGFRFDFTKGFTNTPGDGSAYDAPRIAILKRMADQIWTVNPKTYVILEHFAPNAEEIELSNHGMMIWGNINYNFNEATMGYVSTSDFSGVSYKSRGWSNPNLIGYMESHDEQRLMYKNITYGNSSNTTYNVKYIPVGLARNELAALFFLTVPGPKMIWQFGELGYDISIDFNGRVGRKPIHWEYYEDINRRRLFNTYAQVIRLKKDYQVFQTSNFTTSFSGAKKWIKLTGTDMNAVVMGNFNVNEESFTLDFPATGKWYEYFSQDSVNLTSTSVSYNFSPGEYRLYTSKRIKRENVFVGIKDIATSNSLESIQIWPNPSNGNFSISFNAKKNEVPTIMVFSSLGQKVYEKTMSSSNYGDNSYDINLNPLLNSGIYIVKVQSKTQATTKKIIIQ